MSVIIEETENKTVMSYLLWRSIQYTMDKTTEAALKIHQTFKKAQTGQKKETPQWKICTRVIGFQKLSEKTLKIAAGSMYVRKHFTPEAKADLVEMFDYIRKALNEVRNHPRNRAQRLINLEIPVLVRSLKSSNVELG